MKTRMKSKRGKAIIGIAMAAIMVASVMVAMVPTSTAAFASASNLPVPTVNAGQALPGTWITITEGVDGEFAVDDTITIELPSQFTLSTPLSVTTAGSTLGVTFGPITAVAGGKTIVIPITGVNTPGLDTVQVNFDVNVGNGALETATFNLVDSTGPVIPGVGTYVLLPAGTTGGFVAKDIDMSAGVGGNILMGQKIYFTGFTPGTGEIMIKGQTAAGSATSGEVFSAPVTIVSVGPPLIEVAIFDTSVMTKTGLYDLSEGVGATLSELAVGTPTMDLDIEVGTKSVSKVAMGTTFNIALTDNLNPADIVTLKVRNPDGDMMTLNPTDGTAFKNRPMNVINGLVIPTNIQWKIGTYTIWVVTTKERAESLVMSSNEKTLQLLKGVINVEAEKTEIAERESVRLTVTGMSGNSITITSTGTAADTSFPAGLENNPGVANDGTGFTDTIDADGVRTYVVEFLDTGAYTINVADNTAGGVAATVDITVTEMAVTFDIPTTVYLGEKLDIKGTSNTGDWVAIAFDDVIPAGYDQLMLDGNGAFSKEITTGVTAGGPSPATALRSPGSVRVKAFVNWNLPVGQALPYDVSNWATTDDGSTAILLATGKLKAEISTKSVATGDDFTVSGSADGPRFVDIFTVAPKGSGGRGLDAAGVNWQVPIIPTPAAAPFFYGADYPGCTDDNVAVSEIDHTFSKKIAVRDNADTGTYLVVVLSTGTDGQYGDNQGATLETAIGKYVGDISTKTQDQILSILEGLTTRPGCDDLMWVGYIKVETPYVRLDPIESVAVGEPLKVTGESNREDGFTIVVTCKDGKELDPVTTAVTNGTFEATFDTTGAPVGTYTVKADDGDGHSDMAKVDISLEPKPTATPEPTATAEPTTPPVPTVAPTAEPTPEPTPTKTPGFGAVFAIAGMLAIAYLVLRKRRE